LPASVRCIKEPSINAALTIPFQAARAKWQAWRPRAARVLSGHLACRHPIGDQTFEPHAGYPTVPSHRPALALCDAAPTSARL